MRSPSTKALAAIFEDPKEAKRLLTAGWQDLMENEAAKAYSDACYHAPPLHMMRLTALNALGKFHGVESAETTKGDYAEFLNAGDSYVPTLIRWCGRYRVQSLGDFVETMERRGVLFK